MNQICAHTATSKDVFKVASKSFMYQSFMNKKKVAQALKLNEPKVIFQSWLDLKLSDCQIEQIIIGGQMCDILLKVTVVDSLPLEKLFLLNGNNRKA